jgi:hypothetical protein
MAAGLMAQALFGARISHTASVDLMERLGMPSHIVRAPDQDAVTNPLERLSLDAQRNVALHATIDELREYVNVTQQLVKELTELVREHAPAVLDAPVMRMVTPKSDTTVAIWALAIGTIHRSFFSLSGPTQPGADRIELGA